MQFLEMKNKTIYFYKLSNLLCKKKEQLFVSIKDMIPISSTSSKVDLDQFYNLKVIIFYID